MSKTNSILQNPRFQDLTGQVFGRWTVVGFAGGDKAGNKHWNCICSCGVQKAVGAGRLKNGVSTSCGCFRKIFQRDLNTKHGMYGTPEYRAWGAMWSRCTNKSVPNNHRYADRTPPEIWRDFAVFYADIGPRPSSKHSLDRIKNHLPYGPGNVRWATDLEQAQNTKSNRTLEFQGEVKCLSEWAREMGIDHSLLSWRIKHWGLERALTTHVHFRV